jgi:hypothetical protein
VFYFIFTRIHREYIWWLSGVLKEVCVFEEARSETQTLCIGASKFGLKSLCFWGDFERNTENALCGVAALAFGSFGIGKELDIENFPIQSRAGFLILI